MESCFEDFCFNDAPASFLRSDIYSGQKCHAHRDSSAVVLVSGALDMLAEKILRDIEMESRAIAGFTVSIDRASMPDGLQGFDGLNHDFTAWFGIERGDKANPARIMFKVR